MAITIFRTSGIRGPRSTRSPRNTAFRPAGCRQTPPSSGAYPSCASSSSSSSPQPCTSPMISNGDVHGCGDELEELLAQLGYAPDEGGVWRHPAGRKAVFLGDLVDRGPRIPDVLKIVMAMVEAETAYCVPGNHDMKLVRQLRGKDVQLTHGLADSVAQLEGESTESKKKVGDFLDDLVSHYVFDDCKLVVA